MADRVKYFLLGLLFLVVAGVIAFDRWNSGEAGRADEKSAAADDGEADLWFRPPTRPDGPQNGDAAAPDPGPIRIGSTIPVDLSGGLENRHEAPEPKPYTPPLKLDPKPDVKPLIPPVAPANDTGRVHVVRSGETLGGISALYFKGRVQEGIRLIVAANHLEDPDRIRENDKLVIPTSHTAQPDRKPVVKATPEAEKASSGIPSTYKVKEGDGDLYAICRRFYGRAGEGARIVRVMEMNNLISTRVQTGTVLKLPRK